MSDELSLVHVQLLVVEDNEGFARSLVRSLNKRGYQQITLAKDVEETKACLSQQTYDLIITDMRLGTDSAGGFAVLELVGITSALIVLTANDTVKDCRRAFKAGAWDYISKMQGNSVEVLHTSIQEALRYYAKRGKQENEEWIEVEMPNLIAKYAGQYIAVSNKQVIAAVPTKEELDKLLVEQHLLYYMPVVKLVGNPLSIEELIQRGESATLEFKSTLLWSVRGKVQDDNLQNEVCETIAAFLNSDGGTLLIGVEDKGQIFGLEHDYDLKFKDRDGFEQKLINLLKERIGLKFGQWIKIRFAKVEGKDVCAVEVQKAAKPAFLKVVERGRPDQKRFFVRVGSTSPCFEFEEMLGYIKAHWG
jgi:ActR/RegA family two-component response regulator